MQTLAKGGDMNSLSLQTMLETCRHMVNLLKTAMGHDHATVSRWFVRRNLFLLQVVTDN